MPRVVELEAKIEVPLREFIRAVDPHISRRKRFALWVLEKMRCL